MSELLRPRGRSLRLTNPRGAAPRGDGFETTDARLLVGAAVSPLIDSTLTISPASTRFWQSWLKIARRRSAPSPRQVAPILGGRIRLSPEPVATAFEVPVSLKARAVRRARRPIIPAGVADRVPPGQVIATRWPVLHQGEIPPFDPQCWDFRIWGQVDAELIW